MKEYIKTQIELSIEIKKKCLDNSIIDLLDKIGNIVCNALNDNKKIILFGNGGSAADAQHIAAELIGRFETERAGLPAIALSCNTSNITAIGNDYGFDQIFSRQIEALGKNGDIAIGISTSGNSTNIINALEKSLQKGLITFGFTGDSKCKMDEICDSVFHAPSAITAKIQECHIMAGHIICGIIDRKIKN